MIITKRSNKMSQFTIHPEDVSLFMDLFKGREDVYACQWTESGSLGRDGSSLRRLSYS